MSDNEEPVIIESCPIIDEMTINDRLAILINRLDNCIEEIAEKRNIQEEIDAILKDITHGKINKQTVNEHYFELFSSITPEAKRKISIHLALIFTATAQSALTDGKLMKSWQALAEAKYYLGYYSGLNDPTKQKRIERASKGGKKKATNAKHLENATIKTLKEKKPKNGWRIALDAANDIANDIVEISKTEGFPIPSDKEDLIHLLINLINDNDKVYAAFI